MEKRQHLKSTSRNEHIRTHIHEAYQISLSTSAQLFCIIGNCSKQHRTVFGWRRKKEYWIFVISFFFVGFACCYSWYIHIIYIRNFFVNWYRCSCSCFAPLTKAVLGKVLITYFADIGKVFCHWSNMHTYKHLYMMNTG